MQTPFPMLITIAWRNLWRNHRRSLIMLAAIAIGLWGMIWMTALMRGMVDQMIDDAISTLSGHIQIHAERYLDDPSIERTLPDVTQNPQLDMLLNSPQVTAWSQRIRVPAVVRSERDVYGITLVGIDPQRGWACPLLPTVSQRANTWRLSMTSTSYWDVNWPNS